MMKEHNKKKKKEKSENMCVSFLTEVVLYFLPVSMVGFQILSVKTKTLNADF